VAIGAGTEVAIEAADFVLIRSNLHDLVVALDLAKVVFSRIQYNFAWALVYNLLAVPYAAGVWYPWTHLLLPPQYAGMYMYQIMEFPIMEYPMCPITYPIYIIRFIASDL
jgi:Cu+-exporting ATPase